MRWTERQRAMLREIGVRPWFRDDDVGVASAEDGDVIVAEAAAPVQAPPARAPERSQTPVATAGATHALVAADWLIVGGPLEAADDRSRAAIEAEQELLLANMLRAIGVSATMPVRHGRACSIRLGAPGVDDLDQVQAQVRPRCVLALGRAAAMALLGVDEPLGRLRGRVHDWRGVAVVVTFPLAYLLRNPGEKAKAWADLCLAVGALDAAPL